jgi:hypothetical protein
MQQGQCKALIAVQKPRVLRSYAGDTESLQWSVAINKREGLLVCPDKVYGTYFSYSDHRRNCTRA